MTKAEFISPMLAQSSGPAVNAEDWLFERKLDGLRCVAVREGDDIQLYSRNHLSFTARFPSVVAALGGLSADSFVLDGELVAFDAAGRTSFGGLQQAQGDASVTFVAFDVLMLMGHDTQELTVEERESLVAQVIGRARHLDTVEHVIGDPAGLLSAACAAGWEGLVAKRKASTYRTGRSSDWRKLKCTASQELVIGGYTAPRGARSGFGALLVGYYDGDDLRYAGKVGTGFTAARINELHAQLREREIAASPFFDGEGEKGATWIRPELVANISFTEWTDDGRLRHPSFEGLRPDKDPREVVREVGASKPKQPRR